MIPTDTLIALAKEHKTPAYIYDFDDIQSRISRWKSELPEISVRYAMKANSFGPIMELMRDAGFGVDCASTGDATSALRSGFSREKLLVTQCGFSDEDLSWTINAGITPVLGSLDEVIAYTKQRRIEEDLCGDGKGRKHGLNSDLFLRVNGGVGNGGHEYLITAGPKAKFGIWHEDLESAFKILEEAGMVVTGLHQSLGTNLHNPDVYVQSAKFLSGIARKQDIKTIDLGGGVMPDDDLKVYRELLEHTQGLNVLMEPGRYFVARAGYLVAQVQAVKRTPEATFCVLDTGMQHLIRPALYHANHPIRALTSSASEESMIVVGNACESGDILSMDEKGPRGVSLGVKRGDLVVIGDVGAYGMSMSSDYCGYSKPTEILWSRLN